MLNINNYILATAGHVDHGKSALVLALTGVDPDRLPEEKARSITIDLGFAHLDLPREGGAGGEAGWSRVGIVDVPGHEDFIRNAIAGWGAVDAALLAVAADDLWMPQTEEHLQILTYAGVTHGVVALTKADMLKGDDEVTGAIAEIRRRLAGSALDEAPIVATSVVTGAGLPDLRAALAEMFGALARRSDYGKPRLPVDRVFSLNGVGTVVTGTLQGGRLMPGQIIQVQPHSAKGRVRTVQCYGQATDVAHPGARVALGLPELEVRRPPARKSGIGRQDVVCGQTAAAATTTINVLLARVDRPMAFRNAPEQGSTVAMPLKHGMRVTVHHATAAVGARVYFADQGVLLAGRNRVAQLRCERPLTTFLADRLVLRDVSARHTLAGALVLEPDGAPGTLKQAGYAEALLRLAAVISDVQGVLEWKLGVSGPIVPVAALEKTPFSDDQINAAAAALLAQQRAVTAGGFLISAVAWEKLLSAMAGQVRGFHAAQPDLPGMPVGDLRATVVAHGGEAAMTPAALETLELRGFLLQNGIIREAGHQPALPAHMRAAGQRLRAALAERPLEPPATKHLLTDAASYSALRYLINSGEAVEIGPELVLLAAAVQQAAARVTQHLRTHARASVSDLRQTLGTTRRVMVPLAEYFDRHGVTKRLDDWRVLPEGGAGQLARPALGPGSLPEVGRRRD